jgi:plastocyanin
VAAVSPDDVWAVGYQTAGIDHLPLAEHWDGTAWTAVTVPAPPGWFAILRGVTMVGPTNVWAVGAWYDATSDTYEPLIEHYDGQGWSIVPGAVPQGDSQLIGVATGPTGRLWAVGRNQSKPTSALSEQLCPIQGLDGDFQPASTRMSQGSTVAWSFSSTNGSSHSVTDASGAELFDSGLRPPGGSFVFAFPSAGTYSIVDTATGLTSIVKVPSLASPKTGGVGDTYTITWSTATAPAGFVYDVAVKRPGQGWQIWMTTTSPNTTFVPDSGPGKYQFHARIRNLSTHKTVTYSPPASIVTS